MPNKVPLGLTPRWLFEEHRINDIKEAIDRHFSANYPIRQEWVDEYNELANRIQKRKAGDGLC